MAAINQSIEVNESTFEVQSQSNIGSIIDLQLSLHFFTDRDGHNEIMDRSAFEPNLDKEEEIISPHIFKQLFQAIAENTYTENVMRNLNFLLLTKLMTKVINRVVSEVQAEKPNAEYSKTRIRSTKQVDPYKSMIFTFEKETDLFFAYTKHQKWQQPQFVNQQDIVKNRFLQSKSVFVPRAKLVITYH